MTCGINPKNYVPDKTVIQKEETMAYADKVNNKILQPIV